MPNTKATMKGRAKMIDDMQDEEYREAVEVAKKRLDDVKRRDKETFDGDGDEWEDFRREHYTAEENAAADFQAELVGVIIEARKAKGLSQRKLAALSNVKQPMIAGIEKSVHSPRLETIHKLLTPLGLRLAIVPI